MRTERSDHLPPIHKSSTGASQRRSKHSDHGFSRESFLFPNNRSSPSSPKRYITKSMNTTTTVRKPVGGGPVLGSDGNGSYYERTVTTKAGKRIRKFWWSPKRNLVEIRSEDPRFEHVTAKIGSLDKIDHQPGGGNVFIRDEPTHWQASSKINSLANSNWLPPSPRVAIRSEKLKWEVQPKIGSLDLINHRPGGGNVSIRDDKPDLSHITPRVDCGFIE